MSYIRRIVKDFMVSKEKLVTLDPKATITDAARVMEEKNVGSILIVKQNNLMGIFTERDVVKVVAKGIPINEKLESVMTTNVITIRDDEHISKAVYIMGERGVRHIPVIDQRGKLVGILSSKDIVKYYSEYIEGFE